MKKTYLVVIGNDSFLINGTNLKEAKQTAQVNKRRLSMKGRTSVRLSIATQCIL